MIQLDKGVNLALSIFSKCIDELLSIYEDVEPIRESRVRGFLKQLENESWSDSDFQRFSHCDMHFKWYLLHALFVTGFSYLENFMRSASEHVQQTKGGRIKVEDIKGIGILDTYRKYLNIVGEIEAARPKSGDWSRIMEFKMIRNAIIHKSGRINKKVPLAFKHSIYFGPGTHTIRIKNVSFLEEFVKTSTTYMKLIAAEIEETGVTTG